MALAQDSAHPKPGGAAPAPGVETPSGKSVETPSGKSVETPSGKSVETPADKSVETPSGKGAADENFPVGSLLIAAHLRPHVAKFYAFARAIDDIADNGGLAPEDKIARLNAMDAALQGEGAGDPALATAHRLRDSLLETHVTTQHGSDLCEAFRRDAVKLRYTDWADLLDYCRYSANPVGRYLLDLHGEDPAGYPASDALCSALQVLNHLQDCGDDRRDLDRVYIPQEMMAAHGAATEDLDKPALTPGLRKTLDGMLDLTEKLVEEARALVPQLKSRRLAMESAVIVLLAARLTQLLRRGDPLATRVALTKTDFAAATLRGALWGLWAAGRGVK